MALCKRNNIWWIRLSHNGKRIQRSTGSSNKLAAQELHDRLKADLWRQDKLGERPKHTWQDAVVKWLDELSHKRSLKDDIHQFKWLDTYLRGKILSEIDSCMIEEIAKKKEKTHVSPATVNRLLALIRSVLNRAEKIWKWIEKAPTVSMRYEGEKRERWLTLEEAQKLFRQLPPHLGDLVAFSLATGLRQANVLKLRWKNIDLEKRHATIPASQSKSKMSIPVPYKF